MATKHREQSTFLPCENFTFSVCTIQKLNRYKSIRLTNTHIAVVGPTKVMSCYNLLALVLHLSSNSPDARMYVLQIQRVFIVEHFLTSRYYLTCKNEFGKKISDYLVSKDDDISSG